MQCLQWNFPSTLNEFQSAPARTQLKEKSFIEDYMHSSSITICSDIRIIQKFLQADKLL